MTPVCDPEYWRDRLATAVARGELHRAVTEMTVDKFAEMEEEHKVQLAAAGVKPTDSVLDVGCGYGRLLYHLGVHRPGDYTGIDLSPDLIAVAKKIHGEESVGFPRRKFVCWYAEDYLPGFDDGSFDVCTALWLRGTLTGNGKVDVWKRIELEMNRVGKRVVVID